MYVVYDLHINNNNVVSCICDMSSSNRQIGSQEGRFIWPPKIWSWCQKLHCFCLTDVRVTVMIIYVPSPLYCVNNHLGIMVLYKSRIIIIIIN